MSQYAHAGSKSSSTAASASADPQLLTGVRQDPLFDPMKGVRHERESANAQIARSLKAWRAAGQPPKGEGNAQIPQSGGSSLQPAVRSRMETKLGADLSAVRVHTSGQAAEAAGQLGARAFTVGSDVHFNQGEFAPGSKEGDKLLAHELTHVVQGQKSGISRKAEEGGEDKGGVEVSQPDEPAEKEADQVAEKVAGDEDGEREEKGEQDDKKDDKKDKQKGKADQALEKAGEKKEEAGGDTKESAPPIAAKLEGAGRKVFRVPKAGKVAPPAHEPAPGGGAPHTAAPAAQQEVVKANIQGVGPVEMAKPDYDQVFAGYLDQTAHLGDSMVEECTKLQETAMFYEKKWCSGGWLKFVFQILGSKSAMPQPINVPLFEMALRAALSFQAGQAAAPKTNIGVQQVVALMETALQAHQKAIDELNAFEARIGQAKSAFVVNGTIKLLIGLGASLLGHEVNTVVMHVAPLIGASTVVAKIAAIVTTGAANGAASGAAGAQMAMLAAKKRGEEVADTRLSEAFNQALPGALFSLIGGPVVVDQLVSMLPPQLVASLGPKASEMVTSYVMGKITGMPQGKLADELRGQPDAAPFKPEDISAKFVADIDLTELSAAVEKMRKEGDAARPKAPVTSTHHEAPQGKNAPPPHTTAAANAPRGGKSKSK